MQLYVFFNTDKHSFSKSSITILANKFEMGDTIGAPFICLKNFLSKIKTVLSNRNLYIVKSHQMEF